VTLDIYFCEECGRVGFWSKKLKRFICFNFLGCKSEQYIIKREVKQHATK
jgi:hypothetical protein